MQTTTTTRYHYYHALDLEDEKKNLGVVNVLIWRIQSKQKLKKVSHLKKKQIRMKTSPSS